MSNDSKAPGQQLNSAGCAGDRAKDSIVVKLALYGSALLLSLMGGTFVYAGLQARSEANPDSPPGVFLGAGALMSLAGAALFLGARFLHDLVVGKRPPLSELDRADASTGLVHETLQTSRGTLQHTLVRRRGTDGIGSEARIDEWGRLVFGGQPTHPFIIKFTLGLGLAAAALIACAFLFEGASVVLGTFGGLFALGFLLFGVMAGLYEKIEIDKRQGEIRRHRSFFGRLRSTTTFRVAEFDGVLVKRVVLQSSDGDGRSSTSISYPVALTGNKELHLRSFEHPSDARAVGEKLGSYLELPTRADFD